MSANPVILVVEDEESYIDALNVGLRREGFVVEVARTGAEALTRFDEVGPDLILLDVMLPGVSGIDVCREIRSRSSVPIIMVTAKSSEIDTVVGLEVGADDYVTKPFGMGELLARLRVALRRKQPDDAPAVISTPDFTIDLAARRVTRPGGTGSDCPDAVEVRLTPIEWGLVERLVRHPGRLITQRQLLTEIWGPGVDDQTQYLRVHMSNLRHKLEPDPSRPRYFHTETGMGYRFEPTI